MKKFIAIGVLCLVLTTSLLGWAWAGESPEARADITAQPAEATSAVPAPSVVWGDYKYTFTDIVASDSLDPNSTIIHNYRGLEGHDTFASANYVHLYMTIEWVSNDLTAAPYSFTPLQLKLQTDCGTFWLFGKDSIRDSFLWRKVVRYPDYHGAPPVKVFFTFSTRGAAIDVASAYVEAVGIQEVVNMNLSDQNYSWNRTHFEYRRFDNSSAVGSFQSPSGANVPNYGTTEFIYTPLQNILVSQIIK